MTLDEYFERWGATRVLRESLKDNMVALGDGLSKQEQDALMRVNLIVIRQCLEDFGAIGE